MVVETVPALEPNPTFAAPADATTIERTAAALRGKGYDVHVARDETDAKEIVLALVPEGAEVGAGASATLQAIGVTDVIDNSGRYDAMRPKLWAMDRETQGREIRKL